uniref:Glycoprotein M6A n=1 Tax=Eptatretus burgeri TaxID=7764 RepID=A0A8C4Q986_EPTBU
MDENTEKDGQKKGCAECCIRCLSGVPYASLLATLLLYAGVALFCGGGHEALSSSLAVLDTKFSFPYKSDITLFTVVDIFQYIIYGLAAAFFLFGILLFTEGFFTSAAIRDNYGDFKTAACGRCISAFFLFLTYILTLAWLGILAFSALPVYLTYSVQIACNEAAMNTTQVCVDLRQFGEPPSCYTFIHILLSLTMPHHIWMHITGECISSPLSAAWSRFMLRHTSPLHHVDSSLAPFNTLIFSSYRQGSFHGISPVATCVMKSCWTCA